MNATEGWFTEAEAELMYGSVRDTLACGVRGEVVEVGSYCGRSTVILGAAVKSAGVDRFVHAVDPHEGDVYVGGRGVERWAPTLERFRATVERSGYGSLIREVVQKSFQVKWDSFIAVLFIDGLHDYENVSRDYGHFINRVSPGGLVMFHDYGDQSFPDITQFVNEKIESGDLLHTFVAGCLCVTRRALKR